MDSLKHAQVMKKVMVMRAVKNRSRRTTTHAAARFPHRRKQRRRRRNDTGPRTVLDSADPGTSSNRIKSSMSSWKNQMMATRTGRRRKRRSPKPSQVLHPNDFRPELHGSRKRRRSVNSIVNWSSTREVRCFSSLFLNPYYCIVKCIHDAVCRNPQPICRRKQTRFHY